MPSKTRSDQASTEPQPNSGDLWLRAAHDMRQPLQSLAFTTRIVSLDCSDAERKIATRNLGLVLQSLDGMLRFITEIARLENGSKKPSAVPVALQEISEHLVNEMRPAALAAGVTIVLSHSATPATADPHLLKLVLRGLLYYAVKYGKGDRILVDCRTVKAGRGSRAVIDVCYWGLPPGKALSQQAFIELAPLADAPATVQQALGLAFVVHLCGQIKMTFDHGPRSDGFYRLSLKL